MGGFFLSDPPQRHDRSPHRMSPPTAPDAPEVVVSEQALHKADEFVEAEEGASNKLAGWQNVLVIAVAFAMSAFHLYTAYAIVPTQTLRPVHVGFVLFLCFLVFPAAKRFRHRIVWWDWLAALLNGRSPLTALKL